MSACLLTSPSIKTRTRLRYINNNNTCLCSYEEYVPLKKRRQVEEAQRLLRLSKVQALPLPGLPPAARAPRRPLSCVSQVQSCLACSVALA